MATTNPSERHRCALDTMPAEDRRALEESNSVRSLLTIRFNGGAVGMLLPLVLIAADFATSGEYCVRVRDSLSAYYHSGARDVFVIGLGIVGFLLFSYKRNRRSAANTMSSIAGVAAIGDDSLNAMGRRARRWRFTHAPSRSSFCSTALPQNAGPEMARLLGR